MKPKSFALLLALLLVLAALPAVAQIDARMLRYPDVSATQIAFVYAGDVWVVPKDGGTAHRLSTPKGEETFPRFSPDGTRIAFSADYDGNRDIYVLPAEGGVPERLTHHPAPDRMLDWFPDGRSILFASKMQSGRTRFNQLFRVPATGGLPERLPLPYGEFGMVAPDGRRLAYIPISRDFRTWKRYRGGMAPDIWLFDLDSHAARNLTRSDANDSQPMWYGEKMLYFLSDRGPDLRANIWALDTSTGAMRQVTHFTEYDVHFPAIGPSDIVFEAAGILYRLELPAEKLVKVPVKVVTDLATLKPRRVKVADYLANADVSPSAKRLVVEARGDLFSVPAKHGPVLDLTRSSGVAERNPAWSPDGKLIAYFSDRSGEYNLTVRPADGRGKERRVTTLGPGYRYTPVWSPDSKKLAFVDSSMGIDLCDLATGKVKTIDHGLWLGGGGLESFTFSWSPDSRWLAYARGLDNRHNAIFLFDTTTGTRHQVTSGFYDVSDPAFGPEGKYLWVMTDRRFKPYYSDQENTWIYANSTELAAIPLRKEVASPLKPRDDEEGVGDEAKKEPGEKTTKAGSAQGRENAGGEAVKPAGKEQPKGAKKEKKVEPVKIDLDGMASRMVVLPVDPGSFGGLAAVKGKLLYLRVPNTGCDDEEGASLRYWDLGKREEKTIIDGIDGFVVAAGGKKILVVKDETLALIDVAPNQKLKDTVSLAGLQMTVDPRAEWRQIFTDAWRLERDYFYDPGMHGVDWEAMRRRYGRLLDNVVTRSDLNFVIGELIGELNSSHTYRGGGDVQHGKKEGVGLLGADFALEQGAYRITHIVRGAPWDVSVRSPLAAPGVTVEEGDWLLAVNHVPLDTSVDPWAAFQGLAGKTVVLTVNGKPTMEGARDVLVRTLKSEYRLRNLEWIETKRERVDRKSGGRIGYIYVPDTGRNGQNELVRQFRAQYDRAGLIIDERFNSGGQIPDRFVELLDRPLYCYWRVRNGRDWQWPPVAATGRMAMLINGWSGSGGDAFPLFFRERHLGKLIGTRTWGGLIGISGVPRLIDGGMVTVPTFGIYSTSGSWIVEGHGIDPDIEVVDDPSKMVDGGDPQLDRAVQVVLEEIEKNPPRRPKPPAYPDRSGR
ncbi:MAG: peptidase S41 [Acidobacteria bacterium]|nr:peptidase S41 [Acidobacteriota bacterium]